MQWEKAIETYSFYLRLEQGMSENTIESYQYDVNRLANYCQTLQSNNSPILLSAATLKDFVYQLSKEVKPPTQSRIISGIKGFFVYLQLEGYRNDNPTQLLEVPKIRKTFPDTLSTKEVDALIAGIDNESKYAFRNHCMLELLYSCGLRVSELTQLNKSDIFFEKALIRIRGKGDKMRWVPVAENTLTCIEDYIALEKTTIIKGFEDRLFLNNRGKELTRNMVFTIVKNAALRAKINKNVSPHTLRHSFATHLVENGADIQLVQHMMGHASITTTERYIHMSQRHLKEAIRHFHPRAT
jgi:integrase/recombinase XerD